MKIYPEFKRIAICCDKIKRLSDKLAEKVDLDGLRVEEAELISGCKEHKGHLYKDGGRLDNCGITDDDYYCYQETGYCEDDYHGVLYFKTNVPGQFVSVPFEM